MALSSNTFWECNTSATAADVNGGGFNTGNANFLTNLATDAGTGNTGSPIVSSASYNFAAADVNAWVYIKSGTSWTPGWYQIASVSSNKATLKAAIGQAVQLNSSDATILQANTVAGCGTTGTLTSGTFGIDYSQGTSSITTASDLASTIGTTSPATITSSGKPFGLNYVGNLIHINSGTNWTAGWYEIVSVSGTTATVDRAVGTSASLSSGTFHLGGAISLGNALDSTWASAIVGGNAVYVKTGSYSPAASMSGAAGTATSSVKVIGYNSLRGDNPTGSSRPTLAMGANNYSPTGVWATSNIIFSSSATSSVTPGSHGRLVNCKVINNSTTTARAAVTLNPGAAAINCELISYRGNAVSGGTADFTVDGCYIHDSDVGISSAATSSSFVVINNIIESCVTAAIKTTAANTTTAVISNNTLYGGLTNLTGTGISLNTGCTAIRVFNNIITGFVTGISCADASEDAIYGDYNNFYNNTTDVSNFIKHGNDIALNPNFANIGQYKGTAATTNGSVLTDGAANFANVIDNQDFVYIISGTGITVGQYLITAHTTTTLTLDIAPGTSAVTDKAYQVTTGRNFAIGINLKRKALPGTFPASLTKSYNDIGGVQRREYGR